jgi:hypothetical protein
MELLPPDITPESWLVSAGRSPAPGAPLNVPLIPASNFIIGAGREYSRDDGTPTWEALEEIVGGLESGKAVAFASGMAAIAAVFDQLAAGSIVVLPDDLYQGVAGLAAAGAERRRWSVQRVPVDDTAGWVRACATEARSDTGSRQHLRHAVEPAAARLRCHRLSAIGHQVHWRSLRPARGCRHDEGRRPVARPQEISRVDWRDTGNVRGLPCGPRRENTRASAAPRPKPLSRSRSGSSGTHWSAASAIQGCSHIRRMRPPSACSGGSAASSRSICMEGPSSRMASVETLGSFAMRRVWVPWNRRWNDEPGSRDRSTCRLRCSDSASASRTSTISGRTSIRQSARLRRDAVRLTRVIRRASATSQDPGSTASA